MTKDEKLKMRQWAENQNKQEREWLVIQFVAPETRRSMIPFYDKLKLDLQKDRYIQVQKKQEESEDWKETVRKMGEYISAAFQKRIKDYKAEVKNNLKLQSFPGWNFCNYFVICEGLAFTMIQCGNLELALSYYQSAEKDIYNSLTGKIFKKKNQSNR